MRQNIPILRGLAILAVVLSHSAGWGHTAMFYWAPMFYRRVGSADFGQFGSLSYYILLAIRQITWFAVPAFLFISGFAVTYAVSANSLAANYRVVRGQLRAILLPYVTWSLVVFVTQLVQGKFLSPLEYVRRFVLDGAMPPYFFIPLLIQFYLLSPLIGRWAKAKPGLLLLVFALIAGTRFYAPSGRILSFVRELEFVRLAFFFPLGAVCFFHQKHVRGLVKRHKSTLLVATAVLLGLSIFEVSTRFRLVEIAGVEPPKYLGISIPLYCTGFLLLFFAFNAARHSFGRTLEWIGARSYGVYLVHVIVGVAVAKMTSWFFPRFLEHEFLFSTLITVTSIALPLLFMTGVAKSPFKAWYRYLFGSAPLSRLRGRRFAEHQNVVMDRGPSPQQSLFPDVGATGD